MTSGVTIGDIAAILTAIATFGLVAVGVVKFYYGRREPVVVQLKNTEILSQLSKNVGPPKSNSADGLHKMSKPNSSQRGSMHAMPIKNEEMSEAPFLSDEYIEDFAMHISIEEKPGDKSEIKVKK